MDITALMYAPRNKLRAPAYSQPRCGINKLHVNERARLLSTFRKIIGARKGHSSKFQYGRRSDRRDACLPTPRRVIGSTDIRLFYEIGDAPDEFIALILDTNVIIVESASFISRSPFTVGHTRRVDRSLDLDELVVYHQTFNICLNQNANGAFTITDIRYKGMRNLWILPRFQSESLTTQLQQLEGFQESIANSIPPRDVYDVKIPMGHYYDTKR
jgi:hypothetical protein